MGFGSPLSEPTPGFLNWPPKSSQTRSRADGSARPGGGQLAPVDDEEREELGTRCRWDADMPGGGPRSYRRAFKAA
jgi:hypothetical protein